MVTAAGMFGHQPKLKSAVMSGSLNRLQLEYSVDATCISWHLPDKRQTDTFGTSISSHCPTNAIVSRSLFTSAAGRLQVVRAREAVILRWLKTGHVTSCLAALLASHLAYKLVNVLLELLPAATCQKLG